MNSVNLTTVGNQGPRYAALPWAFDNEKLAPEAVRSAFRTFGIVLVRHVLDREELRRTRAVLDRAFASEYLREVPVMCPTETLKHAAVWSMMFKERVVAALHAALGPELCYHQDLDVQRNNYGQRGWKPHTGWHMDSGSEGANAYLRAADYRFAKCGIFLQDFDNGWGGGIRIKPKSHRGLAEPKGLRRRLFFARRALSRAASIVHLDFDTLHAPLQAGDFCFFDSRLLHSSVPPSLENIKRIGYDRTPEIQGFWRDIPPEHTKYVIYWDASNAAMVPEFLRNSRQRAERELPGMVEQYCRPATFTRILAVRFPDDYPEDFVRAAQERHIGIVSLSQEQTDFYKSKLRTMQLLHPMA
jgi:hypothetical protein